MRLIQLNRHFPCTVDGLKDAVAAAVCSAAVESIRDLYRRLQDNIDGRKPVCSASGACCRFDDYGHRLYVTTLELAAFLQIVPTMSGVDGGGCRFQIAGLCSVHPARPFGCRVFFCDPSADQWQTDQYEAFHGEIKRLHDSAGVPYFYVEWRDALHTLMG